MGRGLPAGAKELRSRRCHSRDDRGRDLPAQPRAWRRHPHAHASADERVGDGPRRGPALSGGPRGSGPRAPVAPRRAPHLRKPDGGVSVHSLRRLSALHRGGRNRGRRSPCGDRARARVAIRSAVTDRASITSGRVLVTGASRGIGRAVAELLVSRGARVFATGRDGAALESLRALAPEQVATFEAELTDEVERRRLVEFATSLWGGLDGMVLSAGIVRYQEALAITEADLRAQLDVNLIAPTMLLRDFGRHLRDRGTGGAAVLVGSTLGMRPAPMTAAYAATKAGLHALARGFAHELGAHGIRVNAVAPGIIDTEMIRAVRLREGEVEPEGPARDARIEAEVDGLRALCPEGRLGTPEQVAEAVAYLLDAEFVTGEVYVLDGGLGLR
ncbi:MAG: hypothetical protein DRJ42_13520 [Deltaproteobacteria bacterium]|nr:MAG: hypothetical protein DRJ42_13520 [Deltaproteobacteria bacterium]